jgi:hypothetical protein
MSGPILHLPRHQRHQVGCGRRDGEVVETIEDFAGMKDSGSGLLPDHTTVINYNTSWIPLAGTRSLDLHENHVGEHYRQMGLNALLTSLKLNYAAPRRARRNALGTWRGSTSLRRCCVARRSHPRR